jgi:chemotaxis protein CheD
MCSPGNPTWCRKPAVLRTVLGSCVGVTFLVPRLGIGALCHPMMPNCPPAQLRKLSVRAGPALCRFCHPRDREPAGFAGRCTRRGGGKALRRQRCSDDQRQRSQKTIGKQNCEAALRVLAEEGFTVAASCLGGTAGVHISFETVHGEVRLRWLDSGKPNRRAMRRGLLIARIAADKGREVAIVKAAKIRVLIVDDSAVVRQTLTEILSSDPKSK